MNVDKIFYLVLLLQTVPLSAHPKDHPHKTEPLPQSATAIFADKSSHPKHWTKKQIAAAITALASLFAIGVAGYKRPKNIKYELYDPDPIINRINMPDFQDLLKRMKE